MKKLAKKQYVWLILAIIAGALTGHFCPEFASKLQPLYKSFINLIKTFIAPIIFCSIVVGIANPKNKDGIGLLGLKIFIYFEVISVLALLLGMIVGDLVQPGVGLNIDPSTLDSGDVSIYQKTAATSFLSRIIPESMFASFTHNEFIQVLLIAVLFGVGARALKDKGRHLVEGIEAMNLALFKVIGMIVKLVPLAAFGSIAYTIGKYGAGTIGGLFKLVLVFYGTVAFFIIFILGAVLWYYKINIFKFIRYIGEEILLVVTTTSSEVGMPALIQKLEDLGCGKSTSSLVVTSGFSFNMDGSYIYLTLAYVFLAQALGIQMSFQDQVIFFLVAAITSKGAAGVAGSGFITLASTIAMTPNQTIPVQSIALLLAIDQFMSMGRAITNYVGNGVAGLVLSIWEKEVKGREVNKKLDK